jgi:hypothetical protein
MKNNISHYQHYANAHQHPKFKMLRVKYGWEGEGKFWALNNMIADSDQCQLDLSRKFIVADILDLFQMQHDEFTNFINFLVEDCELINRVGDIITTETVQENYSKVMSKRVRNKTDYESKTTEPEIQNSEIPINSFIQNFQTSENIQSKVKESKVKDIYANQKSFYKKQLDFSTEKEKYQKFIDILFGENDLKKPLDSVLCLKDQVDAEQFSKLLLKKTENKTFTFVLQNLENTKKYTSGKKSLYLILVNWFKTDFK